MALSFKGLRTAVLGIGNELNGDDAAGVLVARGLKGIISKKTATGENPAGVQSKIGSLPEVLVIDAGLAPENFSGPLRRFRPQLVIFVDAADLGQPPGSSTWIDWQDLQETGGSTHLLSPSVLANFLIQELSCRIAFIGIQPAQMKFGSKVSQPFLRAVNKIVQELVSEMGF